MEHLILPITLAERLCQNTGDPANASDVAHLLTTVNVDSTLNKGRSDWRLPDLDELRDLRQLGVLALPGSYWSATKQLNGFRTLSDVGYVGLHLPKTYLRFIPVRG
jgi:hypothetical protein